MFRLMSADQLHAPAGAPHSRRPYALLHCLYHFSWIFAVYVLSIGPAWLAEDKFPSISPFVDSFYYPLERLAENCPPFRDALLWYIIVVWKVPVSWD